MRSTTVVDDYGYRSPFSWRYGSEPMRAIWSERYKRLLWRRIWVELAAAQHELGVVSAAQLDDLRAHMGDVDVRAALDLEEDVRHDLVAELRTYAAQCAVGGGILHLGATSLDIEDNADVMRQREALALIIGGLRSLVERLTDLIEAWAEIPTTGLTHMQPAEPTTVGHRLALYAYDLLLDLRELRRVRDALRGKGIRGAVGSSASFVDLLAPTGTAGSLSGAERTTALGGAEELELRVMCALGLEPVPIAGQTYPRKQDWFVGNVLAGIGGSLQKFAFDLRLLQSPGWAEWFEPAGPRQVSSSAMPFKRNPVDAETVGSLARLVAALPGILWSNASHALFERTLDDSANRQEVLPVAFLAVDEMLQRALRVVGGLEIDERAIAENLARFHVFAATERLLLAGVKAGGDRQHLHEVLREHCVQAWIEVRNGRGNPLRERLAADREVSRLLRPEQIVAALDARTYVGLAPRRAREVARLARREAAPGAEEGDRQHADGERHEP